MIQQELAEGRDPLEILKVVQPPSTPSSMSPVSFAGGSPLSSGRRGSTAALDDSSTTLLAKLSERSLFFLFSPFSFFVVAHLILFTNRIKIEKPGEGGGVEVIESRDEAS